MKPKTKSVRERIHNLEDAITRAREYLATGKHADWHGFRPIFFDKQRDGKKLPPHKDWVRNVFLPGHEKALVRAQKVLDALEHTRR